MYIPDDAYKHYTHEELVEKMMQLNQRTMSAPPHLRVQMAEAIAAMQSELARRLQED